MSQHSRRLAIDVPKVFALFGGVASIVSGFAALGITTSYNRVDKWRVRGRIPMQGWLDLMLLWDSDPDRPHSFVLNDFLKETNTAPTQPQLDA